MVDVDQYARKYGQIVYDHAYSPAEARFFWSEIGSRINGVDDFDGAELKKLLPHYPWFKISQSGALGDDNAWLIVQHNDRDPAWQRQVLKILEPLVSVGETKPANYAYLFDRVAASFSEPSKRRLQRYGTQGSCVGAGLWQPLPVEDPPNLDARRASVGLEMEARYIARFEDVCRKRD